MVSLYSLKPRFQSTLRPLVRILARSGITANQVTVATCLLSAGLGLLLAGNVRAVPGFLLLPGFFAVRMALNAIDGMLAREHNQRSALGAYLNELTDVVSDAFLYLPFAYVPGFPPLWVGVTIVLAIVSEMAGTVAVLTGASRRYDGPMGKSDRAFVFGALALWIGLGQPITPRFASAALQLMVLLLAFTVVNRVRAGLSELDPGAVSSC